MRRKWAACRHRPRLGKPPTSEEIRQLILRMARENSRWGYFRIRGGAVETRPPRGSDHDPIVLLATPRASRRSRLTWKQFFAHGETLVAADFFSVDTIFLSRSASLYMRIS